MTNIPTLSDVIADAEAKRTAIGHFNISNLEALWAIFRAAKAVGVPVIVGLSEGERDFVGVRQAVALVKSIREEYQYPIFINADHTYSVERVKEAIDAGFDSVIFDGAQLSFEENIAKTKECVEYARANRPGVLVEAEVGYIGTSSKVLDAIPEGVKFDDSTLTSPEQAERFVKETGVDLFAPAVGNMHGMFRNAPEPRLDIERIRKVRAAAGVPLVLHGGSGTSDEDFREAIKAGISLIHINTEIRVAFAKTLSAYLTAHPDEVAPYKIMKEPTEAMQKVIEARLRLFSGL